MFASLGSGGGGGGGSGSRNGLKIVGGEIKQNKKSPISLAQEVGIFGKKPS